MQDSGITFVLVLVLLGGCADESVPEQAVTTVTLRHGELTALFRDNSESLAVLSGIQSLFSTHAPEFDAIDPEQNGASAGLNFEHIIAGHDSEHNLFAPRKGPYALFAMPDGRSVELRRKAEDSPWGMASTTRYTLTAPHSIDLDFHCTARSVAPFGERKYAVLFWANYMNDVEDHALHFRGVAGPGEAEKWIRADAPKGHAHWNKGGTYRAVASAPLEYDADLEVNLNSWSYDYPRFTQPFYFGKAAHGMVYILMFDQSENIRFSLFKFKLPKLARPAWDFQFVIRDIQAGKRYGYRARAIWKKFVSPEDCWDEYRAWARSL